MRISDWSSDVCSSDLVADLFFAVAELVEHLLHSRVAGILVHGNSYRIWLSFSVVISIPSIDGMCLLIDFATATIASWTVFELRMRSGTARASTPREHLRSPCLRAEERLVGEGCGS